MNENGANERSPLLSSSDSGLVDNGSGSESNSGFNNSQGSTTTSDVNDRVAEKRRWLSVRIMYLTCFLSSVAFSISMSSIWPFLSKLDSSATTSFLGWVVASFSLGQFLGSPLFGWWANKRKQAKEPLIISMIIFTLCCLMYTYLQDFPSYKKYWMLVSRFLIGFGAGNISVVRAYVSAATTLKERTAVMANLATFQALGFIVGPGFQTACVPLGYPGPFDTMYIRLNMYTLPVMIAAVMEVINMLLVIFAFTECHKDDHAGLSVSKPTEAKFSPSSSESDDYMNADVQSINSHHGAPVDTATDHDETAPAILNVSPDIIACCACIGAFFAVLFVFSLFETILTPLSMHEIGWSQSQATLYVGILLIGGAVLSVGDFITVKYLAKKFDERKLLVISMLLCMFGFIAYLPWGDEYPPLEKLPANASVTAASTSEGGCPRSYSWCLNTPKIYLWQFILANGIITIGYPGCNVLVYALYSKILGPKPQGTMMGFISASGSLARMLGPIFVSHMYEFYGPRWTFSATAAFLLLTSLILACLSPRMISFYDYIEKKRNLSTAADTLET